MKKILSLRFMLLGLFALLLNLLPAYQVSAEGLSAPETAIEEASNKLKVKMQDPAFSKDFKQLTAFVEEIIYPHVDFDHISALVLGKHWKTASAAEKTAFKKEFQTLLVRTYSRAFLEFKDWSIRFLPLTQDENPDKVIVKTEVLQPGRQPIAVNYRMVQIGGSWKAYDITIEGVSLVTNYRTNFKNEIERTGSLQSVIDSLVKRNKEALANPNAKETS